ncbi:MAG: hypothetical protein GWO00_09160, partial [Gemmatimonadetes bacterium]|nr:hypothetical protein [Gemmatimonadota bacterium]NIT87280.1 hypothetical protein [Gemmatimonadota bacterium]NIU31124.1 hypothetical protein [Gemmatimonadota bacterium]NIV61346.1 hypothetical protein [Gemmatimonadota bacterium]NIW64046.1 hypothetical protein [Gemmatimonadota bacterium]
LILPRRPWSLAAAWAAAGLLVLAGVLWIGEVAARLSLARSLNLYLDIRLLGAVSNLLRGALGTVGGALVMAL